MLKIRQATLADIDIISDFQYKMALETENLTLDKDALSRGVRSCLKDVNKGIYFLAEESNHILGSLLITYEWSDWRNKNVWWIQSVFVEEGHREKGIFTALFQHVKDIVEKDHDLGGLRLYVDNYNKTAKEVYSKLGMDGDHYSVYEWMK